MIKTIFESIKLPKWDGRRPKKYGRAAPFLMIGAIIACVASGVLCYFVIRANWPGISTGLSENKSAAVEAPKYYSRLTGEAVPGEAEVAPKIIAVMVNNNPEGYPLAGLNDAAVVYEAPVEGNITRFLAIFSADSNPVKVGPVRSARPYYLDWLSEYGTALYMHCGGSKDGLSEIKERGIFDADEFFRGSYFWRNSARIAPHNLYTSGEKWRTYLEKYGGAKEFGDWQGFYYGETTSITDETASAVGAPYGSRFVVGWRFDAEKNIYIRTLNGEDFLDDQNSAMTADNVVIEKTSIKVIDEIGRRNIRTTGEGEALIFRDGKLIRGVWKKENNDSRTHFFDREQNEINLKAGKTWVMFVPEKMALNISG